MAALTSGVRTTATTLYLPDSASSRLTVSEPVRPPAPVTATLIKSPAAALHLSGAPRCTAVNGRCWRLCARPESLFDPAWTHDAARMPAALPGKLCRGSLRHIGMPRTAAGTAVAIADMTGKLCDVIQFVVTGSRCIFLRIWDAPC